MTDFSKKPFQDQRSPLAWQAAKEKRKQQLAAVRRRRRVIYELMRKMQERV